MANVEPKYLNAKQLAERTGYSARTFQDMAARGQIAWAFQPSGPRGKLLFDADGFEAWWRNGSAASRRLPPDDYRLIDAVALQVDLLSKQRPAGSYVYFMLAPPSFVKIGVTTNLSKRASEIKLGNPNSVRLIGLIPGDALLEKALHERFAEKHEQGEWFLFDNVIWMYIREHTNG